MIEDELAFDTEMSEENSCATALVSKHDKIDETFQLLSDEFEVFTYTRCQIRIFVFKSYATLSSGLLQADDN